ncbi:hypothetical protein COR50_04300 [Chitinophaga caeni]|uniref:Uncharacterized protein n=1 Tax=Chitinophaga caeni TaxID=2029983 RepID=A0A291QR91_9BACT|nr:hypothetical protein [Chitinophaga caeni]ATL46457.1 hypothetical protein COR50_04300 [Chitinophaga caeni]
MKNYYVNMNKQSNGEHEVHAEACYKMPLRINRIPLGQFASCKIAVSTAKKFYSKVNGCKTCCIECHTR